MILFYFRENKEIRVQQARSSVETVKEVHKDNQLKSKAEKERRLREKVFILNKKNQTVNRTSMLNREFRYQTLLPSKASPMPAFFGLELQFLRDSEAVNHVKV